VVAAWEHDRNVQHTKADCHSQPKMLVPTQAPMLFNLAESARGGNTDNVHDYVERTGHGAAPQQFKSASTTIHL
jgi:hypothetical protein